jgi:hypothetical protein
VNSNGGDAAAQAAASAAVADGAAGDQAGAQTAGQIEHPHGGHTDSWAATKNADGSVSVSKSHTYDDHSNDD